MALHTPHLDHQNKTVSFEAGGSLLRTLGNTIMCVCSLRRRYLFTNARKLRLRYMVPMFVVTAFSLFSALNQFVITSEAEAGAYRIASYEKTSSSEKTVNVAYSQNVPEQVKNPLVNENQQAGSNNVANFLKKPKINPTEQNTVENSEVTLASFYKIPSKEEGGPVEIKIESGQTVAGQLQELGVPAPDAYEIVEALGEHFDPRRVRPGQSFEVEYTNNRDTDGVTFKNISKMTMPLSPAKQIVVYKENEAFKAKEIEKSVTTSISAGRATVKYSLYGSAAKANIPDEVIANMIKIFSWNVDFQRDIRSGDEIEILYETKIMDDGTRIGYGDILFARLVTGGRDLSLYRHKMKNGHIDYFDPEGNSIKRTLMKTPIDGARMSSGYGMRRHPVLGYNKMHKGVDFAAPRGTPIYAAGDGVIESAGRKGSYGNYIRIKHNSKLKTAYAHLHRISKGIRPGVRVKQGQVIGTVGTTGRSTGPHLHYEVLLNGKHANPRGVNVPTGETLNGTELERFKANKVNFDQKFAQITRGEKYASIRKENYNN